MLDLFRGEMKHAAGVRTIMLNQARPLLINWNITKLVLDSPQDWNQRGKMFGAVLFVSMFFEIAFQIIDIRKLFKKFAKDLLETELSVNQFVWFNVYK